MSVERFRTRPGERPERFLRSPYYHLISNNLDHLRRRIDKSGPSEFPVFDDLKELGVTDYIAFMHQFRVDTSQGMMGSWSTDAPDGFCEDMIAALLKHAEPSRGGGQDGGARPARRQHAHHLSRRRRGQARAERPDQARRRRDDPRRAGDGRHAQVHGARRKEGRAGLHRHAQPVLRRDRRAVQPQRRRDPELPRRRLPRRLSCGRHKEPSKVACQAAMSAVDKATRAHEGTQRRPEEPRARLRSATASGCISATSCSAMSAGATG